MIFEPLFRINDDGYLLFSLDNGCTWKNIGPVRGDAGEGTQGPQGPEGPAGADGKDGKDGVDGQDGQDGRDGTDGINGVTPLLKIVAGYLYASYDNWTTQSQLGKVQGEQGERGLQGFTPYIDSETKHWFINNEDTGILAQAEPAGTLNTTATTTQTTSASESLSGNVTLHKVAKTGDYNDLLNKPSSNTDTKNTAGVTDSGSKLFLIGANTQATDPGYAQTYTDSEVYETDGKLHANRLEIGAAGAAVGTYSVALGSTITVPMPCSGVITDDIESKSTFILTSSSVYDAYTNYFLYSWGLIFRIYVGDTVYANDEARTISSFTTDNNKVVVTVNSAFSSTVSQLDWKSGSIGYASYTEGGQCTSSSMYTHAEGYGSRALGSYSHAEGYSTYATGTCSHSEGGAKEASGQASHAEGEGTMATNPSEHAEGQYNVSHYSAGSDQYSVGNKAEATLHSIGCGASVYYKENALEVMHNGDMYVKGVGNYDGVHIKGETGAPTGLQTLQEYIASLESRIAALEGNNS